MTKQNRPNQHRSIRFTFVVSPAEHAALTQKAADLDVSVAHLIRKAIAQVYGIKPDSHQR